MLRTPKMLVMGWGRGALPRVLKGVCTYIDSRAMHEHNRHLETMSCLHRVMPELKGF